MTKLRTFDVEYSIKGTFVERVYDSTCPAEAVIMAMDRLEYNPIRITEAREVEIVCAREVDDD